MYRWFGLPAAACLHKVFADMSFVIFDTEYTSWAGCQEYGWRGYQKKEIVQIAAIKVSDDLETVEAEFNVYCRPTINPVLSTYFENLSGITNAFLQANGITFAEAYQQFKDFAGSLKCWSHSWGSAADDLSDGHVINENLRLYDLSADNSLNYGNIAAWLRQQYQKAGISEPPLSSGQIAKVLHHEADLAALGLDEHNALYDVYSILGGLRHFKADFIRDFK